MNQHPAIPPRLLTALALSIAAHLSFLSLPGPERAEAMPKGEPILVAVLPTEPAPKMTPAPALARSRATGPRLPEPAPNDEVLPAATPTPAPRRAEVAPTPTPPPPEPSTPEWLTFVRTDGVEESASSSATQISNRNTRSLREQTRTEVMHHRLGDAAPPSAQQVGTSTTPGLPRPLRSARDTRGTDFDAKRATTDAAPGGSISGAGEQTDRTPNRTTLARSDPQPAGAVQSLHAPASADDASPSQTDSVMPATPSSPRVQTAELGVDGRPDPRTAKLHQELSASTQAGEKATRTDQSPQPVPESTRDPWWRPSVVRVVTQPEPKHFATTSRPSEPQPDTPSDGDLHRRTDALAVDRVAATEQSRRTVADLAAPPPREAALDHDPIPDVAETPPTPTEEVAEAAPSDARTRPQPTEGEADAVRELREALGWGRTEDEKRRPRQADPGLQGSPAVVSASSQTVLEEARIAGRVSVETRKTPLGVWLAKVDERIRSEFFARDLPAADRALGIQGVTTVLFTIDASGRTRSLRLQSSSGHDTLDALALASIPKKLPRMPRSLGRDHIEHRVVLRYRASDVQGTGR